MSSPTVIMRDARNNCWYRYESLVKISQSSNPDKIISLLAEVEKFVDSGLHAAGFVSYEAAPAFDSKLSVKSAETELPLAWFAIFRQRTRIQLAAPCTSFPLLQEQPEWGINRYCSAFEQVKQALQLGAVYQINLTYRSKYQWHGTASELFLHLARSGQATYGAFFETPNWAVCSASPELFFTLHHNLLTSRPMKGTTARHPHPQRDRKLAYSLQNCPKNRAENLMIVDMLRNDMGRIAVPGTITADKLFALEKYPTVWQLTSTVNALTEAAPSRVFQALFPCASITGAPKRNAMQLISRLEDSPRSIYTGSIGLLDPDGYSQFNVAIRTLLFNKLRNTISYGSGGGIVWDSTCLAEWNESKVKRRIIKPAKTLLSTLRLDMIHRPLLLFHLRRLTAAAHRCSIPFDRNRLLTVFNDYIMNKKKVCKIRITVTPNGKIFQFTETAPPKGEPVQIYFAKRPVDSSDPRSHFKTTDRTLYSQLSCHGNDPHGDTLLWNRYREITETVIANLVLLIDGQLLTPHTGAGLLPGTRRAALLAAGKISEARLTVDDLYRARKVWTISDLRGWRPVRLPSRPSDDFFQKPR